MRVLEGVSEIGCPRNNYIEQGCRDIRGQTYVKLKRNAENGMMVGYDQTTSAAVFGLSNMMMLRTENGGDI